MGKEYSTPSRVNFPSFILFPTRPHNAAEERRSTFLRSTENTNRPTKDIHQPNLPKLNPTSKPTKTAQLTIKFRNFQQIKSRGSEENGNARSPTHLHKRRRPKSNELSHQIRLDGVETQDHIRQFP